MRSAGGMKDVVATIQKMKSTTYAIERKLICHAYMPPNSRCNDISSPAS